MTLIIAATVANNFPVWPSHNIVAVYCLYSPQETKDNELRYVAATEVAILRKLTSCRFILTMMEYYEVHIYILQSACVNM